MRFLILLLLFLSFYSCKIDQPKIEEESPPDREKAENYYSISRMHYEQNRYSAAIKNVNLALSEFPEDTIYMMFKGDLEYYSQDYESCIYTYTELMPLVEQVTRDSIYYFLVLSYLNYADQVDLEGYEFTDLMDSALVYIDKYIDAVDDPELLSLQVSLKSQILHDGEKYEENVSYMDDIIEEYDDPTFFMSRAMSLAVLGEHERALNDIDYYLEHYGALADSIEMSEAFRYKAYSYSVQEEYHDAIKWYTKALEYNTSPILYENRSRAYFGLDDIEKACDDLKRSRDLGYEYLEEEIEEVCGE